MKCSMMKAIAICGALAFAVAGCKYDDEALVLQLWQQQAVQS